MPTLLAPGNIPALAAELPTTLVFLTDTEGAELLREHPEVRVIAVAPDKNYIVYYWASFEIYSNNIEASEEGMLGAMRRNLVAKGVN